MSSATYIPRHADRVARLELVLPSSAMPLPALIEVAPFSAEQLEAFRTTKSEIVIPGSKSITNRAIVLAALGDGEVTLRGALWSEDTEAMTDCMRRLGIDITVAADPDVDANRTITVRGCGGKLPNGGTEAEPLELFVQNAGTAARFLTAMVCLGDGVYRLSGVPAWSKCTLGSAPARLMCLLRACLPAPGSSALPGGGRPSERRAAHAHARCGRPARPKRLIGRGWPRLAEAGRGSG